MTTSSDTLYQEISHLDTQVFEAYNACNLLAFEKYFVEDLEFYHDRTGLILSRKTMITNLSSVLCSDSALRIRRELISESLKVYPLENFGAIQIGEHYYYHSLDGLDEKKVEVAKFTHIWKKENDEWKISRVMSYDHQPVVE